MSTKYCSCFVMNRRNMNFHQVSMCIFMARLNASLTHSSNINALTILPNTHGFSFSSQPVRWHPLGQSSVSHVPSCAVRTVIEEGLCGLSYFHFTGMPQLWAHRLNNSHSPTLNPSYNQLQPRELAEPF